IERIGGNPELNLYDEDWPIWTYQAQSPPAKFIFDNEDRRGIAVDSMVSGGCIIAGARVRHSLLFSNVHVQSHTEVAHSVILPNVSIGKHCYIKKAMLDKGCRVPDGMVIGEDLEEDKKNFHITEEGVVLVTPEMLGQKYRYIR